MTDSEILYAGMGSIWAQPNGPNTRPLYLGCHQLGDVEEPGGDLTRVFCPDPAAMGRFKVVGSYQGEPGVPTFTIETPMGKTRDYLERWPCPGNIIVNKASCGRRDLYTNYDRSSVYFRAVRTGRTESGLASRRPGDETESMQSFPFSMEQKIDAFALTTARQTIAALGDLLAIHFPEVERCAGDCGPAKERGSLGVVVGTIIAGSVTSSAMIYFTGDGGATWNAPATDPFAAGEDVSAVTSIEIDRNTRRYIVARGTTDPGNPAEVAYSDDGGDTWTPVELGATEDLYVVRAQGLFRLDAYNIWCVTTAGHIFYSEDGGVTWAEQEDGTLTAEALHCVQFASVRVGYVAGANNALLKTEDGGISWTELVGPAGKGAAAILAMAVVTKNRVFIGYDDGDLYYTEDGGETWLERQYGGSGVGEVTGLRFVNQMVGFLTHDTDAPVGQVYRTRDGGYTWELTALPTNDGVNDIWPVDENLAFVAGNVEGTTGFVGKVFEA